MQDGVLVPPAVIAHLVRRVRERYVPHQDLQSRAAWLDADPIVPTGPWFKHFEKIVVCGEGELVETVLENTQTSVGIEVE